MQASQGICKLKFSHPPTIPQDFSSLPAGPASHSGQYRARFTKEGQKPLRAWSHVGARTASPPSRDRSAWNPWHTHSTRSRRTRTLTRNPPGRRATLSLHAHGLSPRTHSARGPRLPLPFTSPSCHRLHITSGTHSERIALHIIRESIIALGVDGAGGASAGAKTGWSQTCRRKPPPILVDGNSPCQGTGPRTRSPGRTCEE